MVRGGRAFRLKGSQGTTAYTRSAAAARMGSTTPNRWKNTLRRNTRPASWQETRRPAALQARSLHFRGWRRLVSTKPRPQAPPARKIRQDEEVQKALAQAAPGAEESVPGRRRGWVGA